jgi:hypothetical protein
MLGVIRTPHTRGNTMKTLARIAAFLASSFCMLGGLWTLNRFDFASRENTLSSATGLFFIGIAFFVGPMLWLAAGRWCSKQDGQ